MAQPAPFGASEPLHIYQDNFFENSTPMISHAPMPPASKPPRRPLQATDANVVLNPPILPGAKQSSPFKSSARAPAPPLTPLKPQQHNKLNNAVHMMPPHPLPPSTDSLEKKQPHMSKFKTANQKQPGSEGNQPQPQPQLQPQTQPQPQPIACKENVRPTLYPAPPSSCAPPSFPAENFYAKPPGKRVLLEAAPIKELRPAKKPRLDEPLPTPESFAPIADDGSKPGHSYATLIGMAILRSPQRRLTLAQIYKWISDTFSFYKPDDAGWQNSIRHNLSLNKHFIKQERPKDDPGKGNYWAIEPGMEYLFLKDKSSRKPMPTAENVPIMSTRLEPAPPHLPFMSEPLLPPQIPQLPISQASLPALPPVPSSQQPAPVSLPPEVSSDATIIQSDGAAAALDDNSTDKTIPLNDATVHDGGLYSPLPDTLHSSPPIPRHIDVQPAGTPPPMQRPHNSSASKSRSRHRRNFASMDDSGYISSLESSIMRPNQREAHKLLTSEADRPRMRRGRAEEEIARLRASSYDSPSKGRSFNNYGPASSSPLRRNNDAGQMLPPLTPAMKLTAPVKPPPSVSPGTNLRIHRENVNSMLNVPFAHVAALLPDNESALTLDANLSVDEVFYGVERKNDDFPTANVDFDIFQDSPFAPILGLSPLTVAHNGSPVKRSVKKQQRLDRSNSTSALHDVTSSASHNAFSATSFLKVPTQNVGLMLETPSKVFEGLPSSPSKVFLQSPSKMPLLNDENMAPWISMDELCGTDLLEDNDFTGIDMLAGFEKIGSNNAHMIQPPRPPQKPSLGRSFTTKF